MTSTVLRVARVIRAPRERVFAAWTRPELLRLWWGPGEVSCPEAEIDLRPGGSYRLANLNPDRSVIWISGRFEVVDPPETLAYTWTIGIVEGPPTLVRVRFLEHPEGTELVLTHDRFADAAVRDMHAQGWAGCLDKLSTLLEA